ncbi:unnamed protein product [Notodromas monacha]|uniref:Uncharacterized protein n=1 Tax=Notodromas monacha TaxID=399045 RepID=A0A7R9C0S8_9CRUS|nr:unnamed protein product [Notodromas monacha]CAG0924064.1 unnamed protein product [Notodromas monacha]
MSSARRAHSKQYVSVPMKALSSGSGSSSDSEEDVYIAEKMKNSNVVTPKTLSELLSYLPEIEIVSEDEAKRSRFRRLCARHSRSFYIAVTIILLLAFLGIFLGLLVIPTCSPNSSWPQCLEKIPEVISSSLPGKADGVVVPAHWRQTFPGAVSSESNVYLGTDDMYVIYGLRYIEKSAGEKSESGFDGVFDFDSTDQLRLKSALMSISLTSGEIRWQRDLEFAERRIERVKCSVKSMSCLTTLHPGTLSVFNPETGQGKWTKEIGDGKLDVSFIMDVNNDAIPDFILLLNPTELQPGKTSIQSSIRLISGSDGSTLGRELHIPGCYELSDPHVVDSGSMDLVHITCKEPNSDEHLLRLSMPDLVKSALNGTESTVVGLAEKTHQVNSDSVANFAGGIVHFNDYDLRWTNFRNGSSQVLIDVSEDSIDINQGPTRVTKFEQMLKRAVVTGGDFVPHCGRLKDSSSCPIVVFVKTWTNVSNSRQKREVIEAPIATVFPGSLVDDNSFLDPGSLYDVDNPQNVRVGPLRSESVENDVRYGVTDDVAPKPATEDVKDPSSSKPPFVLKVQTRESSWEFVSLIDRVTWFRERKDVNFDHGFLEVENVTVACASSPEATSLRLVLSELGSCIPRPNQHSVATTLVTGSGIEVNTGTGEQMVALVSTTPSLERVPNPDGKSIFRLVTKVNHWRGFMADVPGES